MVDVIAGHVCPAHEATHPVDLFASALAWRALADDPNWGVGWRGEGARALAPQLMDESLAMAGLPV